MHTTHVVALGPPSIGGGDGRGGVALALWGLGVNLLVGAMVIAGVAVTTLSLQMMRRR